MKTQKSPLGFKKRLTNLRKQKIRNRPKITLNDFVDEYNKIALFPICAANISSEVWIILEKSFRKYGENINFFAARVYKNPEGWKNHINKLSEQKQINNDIKHFKKNYLGKLRNVLINLPTNKTTEFQEILGSLTERESQIIKKLIGIGLSKPETKKEIAIFYDISSSRVSQLENRAILKLMHPLRFKKIKKLAGCNKIKLKDKEVRDEN